MRVVLSAAARRDLAGIWTFTAKRWDEAQADRYVQLIAEGFDSLANGTVTGRSADDIRQGYFKLTAGSHLIFYRVGNQAIEIVRILHGRMDFDRHL